MKSDIDSIMSYPKSAAACTTSDISKATRRETWDVDACMNGFCNFNPLLYDGWNETFCAVFISLDSIEW